jgi:hypothetical protein
VVLGGQSAESYGKWTGVSTALAYLIQG